MDACPSDDTLFTFVRGGFPPGERKAIHEHVAGCEECLAVIAEAARYPTLIGPVSPQAGTARRRLFFALAASAVVLVAAGGFLARRHGRQVTVPEPCTGGDAAFFWDVNGHCYTRHDRPLPWNEARADCHARGAEIFTYMLYREQEMVASRLSQPAKETWIGLHASERQGEGPVWITGERLPDPAPSWAEGQPSAASGTCGLQASLDHMNPVSRVPIAWSLASCERPLPYVCKRAPWIVAPSGHAYRVYTQPLSWDRAREDCAAKGAHLATLADAYESAFVSTMVTVNVWIGASDVAREGTFVWITGEPTSFKDFAPLQPDDPVGNDDCLAIGPGRKWYDRACPRRYGYVCERD